MNRSRRKIMPLKYDTPHALQILSTYSTIMSIVGLIMQKYAYITLENGLFRVLNFNTDVVLD
jgi:hypothetical protein